MLAYGITVILHEEFEFDPNKSRENERRHGVDFVWAQRLWDQDHALIPAKNYPGERRFFILAKVDGKLYGAVFTRRRNAVRIISCHRVDARLGQIYEKIIKKQEEA